MSSSSSFFARNQKLHRAFSLVELLVVIAVMTVLIALVAPVFRSIGGAQNLTTAGDLIAGHFELARQTAIAENQRIELRLWDLPDPNGPDSAYRAVQLFRVDNGQPLGRMQNLPIGIMMSADAGFSSILSAANPYGGAGNVMDLTGRTFKSIRFGPDGSTELSPSGPSATVNAWTVTVVVQNAPVISATRPGKNFATIQVDPVTGRSVVYRP